MTKIKHKGVLEQYILSNTPGNDTTMNDTKGTDIKDIFFLNAEHGTTIAWTGQTIDGQPTIVFFAGHGSDMDGTKALAVDAWARENEYGIIRFDYFGHGRSSGDFLDGTISIWRRDCLAVLDHLTSGPVIIVGSSLGGWLMMLAARDRPERIAGLIGVAAAPDFTDDLIWDALTTEQQKRMQREGQIALPNPYSPEDVIIPYNLIVDGRDNFVLRDPQQTPFPVRLLHGMHDAEVPPETAEVLARNLDGDDIEVLQVRDAGHRFSEPEQIDILIGTLSEVMQIAGPAR
jgi:pimeloyl-ACP methyl ester carboxylesterase